MTSPPAPVGELVEHLFRREAGRLVAALVRVFGPARLDLAEDVVQEALVKALREWPFRGVPDNPQGWIVRVARNRALDLLRRERSLEDKLEAFAPVDEPAAGEEGAAGDVFFAGEIEDDALRLVFTCCHPAVPREARVALTLKTAGGFGVPEIARAFLAREEAVAQRLVRAKRRLREAGVRFEVPGPAELPERLDAVLESVYLVFTEGHAAAQGDELLRADVCAEAVRLARLLARHPVTGLPRTRALLALLLFHAARLPARRDSRGDPLLLDEQDRSLWDGAMIREGFGWLDRAAEGEELSPYHLEAAIAGEHARSVSFAATDWGCIVDLYDGLLRLRPSPVAALNRAVALSMAEGPRAGLAALDAVADHPALARYGLLHAAYGSLLSRAGDAAGAAAAYRRALGMPCSEPERRFLARRLGEVERPPADQERPADPALVSG